MVKPFTRFQSVSIRLPSTFIVGALAMDDALCLATSGDAKIVAKIDKGPSGLLCVSQRIFPAVLPASYASSLTSRVSK